jgi:flagellar motor switch protein FliM
MEILSQAEIEALLATLSGDGDVIASEVPPTPGATAASFSSGHSAAADLRPAAFPEFRPPSRGDDRRDFRTIAYEPYDFRRPDKFSKDQLRTLQMLHETFARLFASSLSAYLRVSTHVDLISVEQVPYNEYMRSLTSSIITVFSMDPLAGQAIMEIEFGVVLSMIDRLLGGPGNMSKHNNNLTDIEKALCESIVTRAMKDFQAAWDSVSPFTAKRESMETQAQFIHIVPPNDTVVSILFEIKIGTLRGAMSLCVPYLLLKPITSKLSVQQWFSASGQENQGQNAPQLAKRLERAKVTCACRLGTSHITVRELVSLNVGDTIVLDRRCDEEVDFMIGRGESAVKFRGKPGTSGRKVAIHINRIATQDKI